MFNFLNSAVLIAAAAALIPLLIHLFSRRKVRVVEFSSLRHLKKMQKRQVRRLKIRQLLLLLLRMLIILLAVLAFARPATQGGYIGSHAGVSAAIVLDRSASMQRQVRDGRLFELARQRTREILQGFGESDEVILIPFDRKTYFPSGERFFSSDIALGILDELTPGFDAGNLDAALADALDMMGRAGNLNKELYIVTDRQAGSGDGPIDSLPSDITVYMVELPVEIDGNCGVIDLDLGGQLIEVGSEFNIKSVVQNYDARPKSEMLASLFIDGTRVMQTEFEVEASGQVTVPFRHTVARPGFHSGYVDLADDDFVPDNRLYFSFRLPEQFNVLVVDGDGGGDVVRLALVPSENAARYWSVKTVTPDDLASVRFPQYDAVVLSGVHSLGRVETGRLKRFVDGGGGLFIILGAGTEDSFFDENLRPLFGMQYVAPAPENFSGVGYFSLERFDYGHPIFKPFAGLHRDTLPTFRFFALPTLRDGDNNRDLAFFSNNAPAMVEAAHGRGKMILLAASILPRYSDLAGHSFFVPLVIRTMEYLAGDLSDYEVENYVGENIIRTVAGDAAGFGTVTMVAPDERTYRIAGVEKTGQMLYDCRPIDQPGIYLLKNRARTVGLFPVNLVPGEGEPAALEPDILAEALGIDTYRLIAYEADPAAAVSETRFGRELWKIFLWAVVVLLAVEMIFARETTPETDQA